MAWYLFMCAACNVKIYQLNELLENKAVISSAWYEEYIQNAAKSAPNMEVYPNDHTYEDKRF